jgi:hypothetical protein
MLKLLCAQPLAHHLGEKEYAAQQKLLGVFPNPTFIQPLVVWVDQECGMES